MGQNSEFLKAGKFDTMFYVHGKKERLGRGVCVQAPDNVKYSILDTVLGEPSPFLILQFTALTLIK